MPAKVSNSSIVHTIIRHLLGTADDGNIFISTYGEGVKGNRRHDRRQGAGGQSHLAGLGWLAVAVLVSRLGSGVNVFNK